MAMPTSISATMSIPTCFSRGQPWTNNYNQYSESHFGQGTLPSSSFTVTGVVGKTHTMRHVAYVLQTTAGYDAQVVFVELPDITKNSTFQAAHAALLDALGLNVVKQWVLQFSDEASVKKSGTNSASNSVRGYCARLPHANWLWRSRKDLLGLATGR